MSETELCRLCAKTPDQTEAEILFDRNQCKLLRQIEELIGQRLKKTKDLPQYICKSCKEQTLKAYTFRTQCIQTQLNFVKQKTKSNKKEKRKLNGTVSPIEEKVLNTIAAIKVEVIEKIENDISTLPHITEVLFKQKIEEKYDFKTDSNDDSLNPLKEDQIQKTNDWEKKDCITKETEINLLIDDKPVLKKSEIKLYKKQKYPITTKCKTDKKRKTKEKKFIFICDQCGKHYVSNSDLESHIRRHKGERLFKCEICPESFFLKVGLKRHMLKHAGELPYPCSHCDRRFLDKSHAKKHERTHTNERPYICQTCGKGFTVSHILKAHMLVHTGERAFGCKICNAAFKLKKHLVTHYRSLTHKQNEERIQLSSN